MLLLLLVASLGLTQARLTGAPAEACEDMTPGHFQPPQTSEPPYMFHVMPMDDHYMVTLTGSPNTFRGFYFQARNEGSTTPVGVFSLMNPGDEAQTTECGGVVDGAATHIFNNDKTSVSLRWDGDPTGVTFHATVVEVYDTFWLGLTATA